MKTKTRQRAEVWATKSLNAISKIGQSRHADKLAARESGRRGTNGVAKETGIYSYSTFGKYKKEAMRFYQWCIEKEGVKKLSQIKPDHVGRYLEEKLFSKDMVKRSAFTSGCSALEKLEIGHRALTKHGEEGMWSAAIKEARSEASHVLDNTNTPRKYANQTRIIQHIQKEEHQLAAKIQHEGGARVFEATHIRAEELRPGNIVQLRGKGGRYRETTLSSDTFAKLKAHIKEHGEFKINQRNYAEGLQRAVRETGETWEKNGTHALRYHFAQNTFKELRNNGVAYEEALQIVSERLGHSRPSITEHYLRE